VGGFGGRKFNIRLSMGAANEEPIAAISRQMTASQFRPPRPAGACKGECAMGSSREVARQTALEGEPAFSPMGLGQHTFAGGADPHFLIEVSTSREASKRERKRPQTIEGKSTVESASCSLGKGKSNADDSLFDGIAVQRLACPQMGPRSAKPNLGHKPVGEDPPWMRLYQGFWKLGDSSRSFEAPAACPDPACLRTFAPVKIGPSLAKRQKLATFAS
jgi:hypothetical protein